MEYLAGFIIFFVGWLVLRFLLTASYASGFAEGVGQVADGGVQRLGELGREIDASDLKSEVRAQTEELGRTLNARNFDQARSQANSFGRELVGRSWKLRGTLR
ncbi:MAG: hypothetical protein ACR2PA_14170 [Hyphomicrobiaceae bacterium]